jgi:hypothetical protein
MAVGGAKGPVLRHKTIRGDGRVFYIVRKRIIGNLVRVVARRSHRAQLVRGIDVENERAESTVAVGGIVLHLRDGRFDAEIAAVAVDAGVEGEELGVAAQAELVISLVEIPGAQNQFGFPVVLESGARDYVEDAVGAIAEFRAGAAAAHFKITDVFGIELRPRFEAMLVLGTGTPSTSQPL